MLKLTNLGGQLLGGLFEAMKDFDERYFKSRIGLSKVYELINQNLFKKNLLKLSASDS